MFIVFFWHRYIAHFCPKPLSLPIPQVIVEDGPLD